MQFPERLGQRVAAAFPIVLCSLLLVPMAAAQAPSPHSPQQPLSSAGNNTLSIDVVVTDKSGHPVSGLQKSDFTLLDNKTPTPILGFHARTANDQADDPLHVLIVLDMINTHFTEVAWEREELARFLKQDNGRLAAPTTLAAFSDRGVALDQQFTMAGNDLLTDFDKTQTQLRTVRRDDGFWGDAEMMQISLAQLSQLVAYEKTQPGHKLILVVGPGWPMLPVAGSQEDDKTEQVVFNSIVKLTNGLREANTTLYCLDPYDYGRTNPYYYQGYLKPVTKLYDAVYPALSLQVLAEHSGGEVLIDGHDITGKLITTMRDASAGYVLTFQAAPGNSPNEYHALQVRVDQPRVQVRTTAGYYVHPKAGLPSLRH